jgi:hypothetical protein
VTLRYCIALCVYEKQCAAPTFVKPIRVAGAAIENPKPQSIMD